MSALDGFVFERVLSEDARTRTASLLGHFTESKAREPAVINVEKTHFTPTFYENLATNSSSANAETHQVSLASTADLGSNDVYKWLLGWMPSVPASVQAPGSAVSPEAHVKLTVIRPATEAHILKYTEQPRVMVRETPEMYKDVIAPYIAAQPANRIQWVYHILDKQKEADSILYEDADPQNGFIVVPDLKWDQRTLSSLYLVAIVHDRSLRSIRDLTKRHVMLLRNIRRQAAIVARKRFGLGVGEAGERRPEDKVRCFLHYQPTYYHLHVHILSSDYISHPGAIVGQAHLLDDIIDMLELGVDFRQRTLTYALGARNALFPLIEAYTATKS